MSLTVHKQKEESSFVLKLEGVLDIATTETFHESFKGVEDCSRIVIDFSELQFIDSTGIGAILDAFYLSQENGFSLEFIEMNESVEDLFKTLGLFQIMETIDKGEA